MFVDPRSVSHLSSFTAPVVFFLCTPNAGVVLNCHHLVSRTCLLASLLLAGNGQRFTLPLLLLLLVLLLERESPSWEAVLLQRGQFHVLLSDKKRKKKTKTKLEPARQLSARVCSFHNRNKACVCKMLLNCKEGKTPCLPDFWFTNTVTIKHRKVCVNFHTD